MLYVQSKPGRLLRITLDKSGWPVYIGCVGGMILQNWRYETTVCVRWLPSSAYRRAVQKSVLRNPQTRLGILLNSLAVLGSRVRRVVNVNVFRPHRLHAMHEMQPIATDVACSVVCVFVCVCWIHGWAVQKRLNRSRCRFGGWLMWVQGTMC